MDGKGDKAVRAVLAAVGLGLLGAALFKGTGAGVNVSIWMIAAISTVFAVAERLPKTTVVGLTIAGLAAVGLGWNSSPHLVLANSIAVATGLGLATLGVREFRIGVASVWDLSARLFGDALRSLGEGFAVVADVPWRGLAKSRAAQKNTAVLRGAIIATPLVLLFGSLFSRADAVFNQTVSDAFSVDFSGFGEWLWLSLLFTLFGLAMVGAFAAPRVRKPPMLGPTIRPKIGMTELAVVLCSLCGLFGLFVAIQFQYLFGGTAAVVETTGLTYADYARQGFFELVWVAGLALPLLVGAHAVAPSDSRRDALLFRVLATTLVGLLFVVMASAMVRMQLYVQSYGLTPLRVSSSAFTLWLALVFCWFLASLYGSAMRRFAIGAMAAGLATVAALNFAPPDNIAARYNVSRFAATSELDVSHLAGLSADAVPVVLGSWDRLSDDQREAVVHRYRLRWPGRQDWRGASVSDQIAARAIASVTR